MDLFAPRHLLVILLIALVVFGTKKLKSIGTDLGGAVRGFKEAMNAGEQSVSAHPAHEAPGQAQVSGPTTTDATAGKSTPSV